MKAALDTLRAVIAAPVLNLVAVVGLLLLVASFCDVQHDHALGFTLRNAGPEPWRASVGLLLVGVSLLLSRTPRSERVDRKVNLVSGMQLVFGRLEVRIKVGRIEDLAGVTSATAVVLPANTSFLDSCIEDPRSAFGAFVQEHYAQKVQALRAAIQHGLPPLPDGDNSPKNWPPGTTVLLPPPFDAPIRLLVTGATIAAPGSPIRAEPSTVSECVRQILEATCDKKISHLRMPVIGAGHGGLDLLDAALFIVIALRHYERRFHHVRLVEVLVREQDAPRLREAYRLRYLMRLQETAT